MLNNILLSKSPNYLDFFNLPGKKQLRLVNKFSQDAPRESKTEYGNSGFRQKSAGSFPKSELYDPTI